MTARSVTCCLACNAVLSVHTRSTHQVLAATQPAAAPALHQQQQCTWPRCVLPHLQLSSSLPSSRSSGSSGRDVRTQALRRNGSSIGQINGFGSSSSSGPGSNTGSGGAATSSSSSGGSSGGSGGRGRLQAGQVVAAVAELQATQVGGDRAVVVLCCAVPCCAVLCCNI